MEQVGLFEPIIGALNEAHVRYVIVGGVAVVLHGYARLTADLDLAIDLSPDEAKKAIDTLMELGYRPNAPVQAQQFSDPVTRARWVHEKQMTVFAMHDPADPMRQVDLFAENPIDFESLWARSKLIDLGATQARVASVEDLIDLKRLSGRPQDLSDIEALEAIVQAGGEMSE